MYNRMYKNIDSTLSKTLRISSKREYYYFDNNEKKYIQEEKIDSIKDINAYELVDENEEWNSKNQSLFLNLVLKIENIDQVFYDLCCDDTILGIGLEWKPNKSKLKTCIKLGEFCKKDQEKVFKTYDIELKNITSNVDFKWLIYVVTPGKINFKPNYGNNAGIILGDSLLWSIIVEGEGSIFPIFDEYKEDAPLWYCRCNFTDIYEDEFIEDNVSIILNRAHKAYKYIQPKTAYFNSLMFSELISNAIYNLIVEIKRVNIQNGNDEIIDFSQDGEKGSIYTVLKYFYFVLNFKINSSNFELLESIKTYFDKEY